MSEGVEAGELGRHGEGDVVDLDVSDDRLRENVGVSVEVERNTGRDGHTSEELLEGELVERHERRRSLKVQRQVRLGKVSDGKSTESTYVLSRRGLSRQGLGLG